MFCFPLDDWFPRVQAEVSNRNGLRAAVYQEQKQWNITYFVCVRESLTTDGVNSGCWPEAVHKVWYQTAKKLQTETKRQTENKDKRERNGNIHYQIHVTWLHIHIQDIKHLPSVTAVPLGTVSWFLWQRNRQAAGRRSCPGYTLLPGLQAGQNIKVIPRYVQRQLLWK